MVTSSKRSSVELPPERRIPGLPLTVDTVILTVLEGQLRVVLVKRLDEPF